MFVEGAKVNTPVELSYDSEPPPEAEVVLTERSDNAIPPEPVIVIVLVVPVPEAVTFDPTKFKVVADVDNELPSS